MRDMAASLEPITDAPNLGGTRSEQRIADQANSVKKPQ